MKHFLLASLVLFCIFSCNNNQISKIGEADSILYSAGDTNMNVAMLTAKSTFGQFKSAFRQNKYDSGTCAVKLKFVVKTTPGNSRIEHVWATGITFKNGNYYGVMDEPWYTKEVKGGDTIKINPDNISDWMYAENKILRGGYTIRATRNKMTEQERVHFDATYPFKIEN